MTYPTRKIIPTFLKANPTSLNVIRLHKNGRNSTVIANPAPRREGAMINVKTKDFNVSDIYSPSVNVLFL